MSYFSPQLCLFLLKRSKYLIFLALIRNGGKKLRIMLKNLVQLGRHLMSLKFL